MSGKKLKQSYAEFDRNKTYSLEDALNIIKKGAVSKFDETVEISIALGIDTRKSDQNVRSAIALPHGLGKEVRVAVFARGDKAKEALDAGADIVGAEDLMERISKGQMDFDRCVATPDMMALVGRVGKQLGPRGLMPNPKLGTVTPNVGDAVKLAKSGQVEFRAEKAGIVHAGIGKVSFEASALADNIRALHDAVVKAKPQSSKGAYIKRCSVSSTMGVGVKVDIASLNVA